MKESLRAQPDLGHEASASRETSMRASAIRVHFEGVKAVDDVDLELREREILGLIGPNGAGKTTLVNVLSGFQRPTAGSVTIEGREVTGVPPDRFCRFGLARTFQAVRLFGGLTVWENIEVAAAGAGLSGREAAELTAELLQRLKLANKAEHLAASLPHGDERRIGIARALATRPRFLLLDEPAAGLDESESDELLDALESIRADYDLALLVIEHDMRLIMRLCERIQVLDHGRTIAMGDPTQVRRDPEVLKAYLGTEREIDFASD